MQMYLKDSCWIINKCYGLQCSRLSSCLKFDPLLVAESNRLYKEISSPWFFPRFIYFSHRLILYFLESIELFLIEESSFVVTNFVIRCFCNSQDAWNKNDKNFVKNNDFTTVIRRVEEHRVIKDNKHVNFLMERPSSLQLRSILIKFLIEQPSLDPHSTLRIKFTTIPIPDTSNLLPANKRENANKQRLFSFPDIIPHRIDNPILFFRNATVTSG